MAAIVALAVATGCGADREPAPEEPASQAQEFAIPIPDAALRLDDPGAEPRQRLGPNLTEGAHASSVLSIRSEVFQQLGDEPEANLSQPEVTIPLDSEVTAAQEGGWDVELTLGRAESPDSIVNHSLRAAEGSGAGLTVRTDGSVPELRITPNPESDDIARSTIEQALYQAVYGMIVFPQEPVGEGARWTFERPIAESGMEIVQRTTVTVREISGTVALLDVELQQEPRLPYLEVPGEGRVAVDEFAVAGDGVLTVGSELPLPVEGATEFRGTQLYSDPDSGFTVRQRVTSSTGWSAR